MTTPAEMDATLDLLTPDEVADALRFLEVMEHGQHMSQAEADEWRRRTVAWSRFRLAVETAGSDLGMASWPYVHRLRW